MSLKAKRQVETETAFLYNSARETFAPTPPKMIHYAKKYEQPV